MTFTPRFTIATSLTPTECARRFLKAATISEERVRRMSQRALLLEAHHTTHIEGTHPGSDRPDPRVPVPDFRMKSVLVRTPNMEATT